MRAYEEDASKADAQGFFFKLMKKEDARIALDRPSF